MSTKFSNLSTSELRQLAADIAVERERRAEEAVLYRHHNDPTLTWDGKGPPPRWLLVAIGNGLMKWKTDIPLASSWYEKPDTARQSKRTTI